MDLPSREDNFFDSVYRVGFAVVLEDDPHSRRLAVSGLVRQDTTYWRVYHDRQVGTFPVG